MGMNVKAGKLDKTTNFRYFFSQLPSFGFSFVSPPWLWLWGYTFFITILVSYPYFDNLQLLIKQSDNQFYQLLFFLVFQTIIHSSWFFLGKEYLKLRPILVFASFVQVLAMGLVFWETIILNLGL
jgi:hypothetical protein